MSIPSYSVIIPTRDRAGLLVEAVRSAQAQSAPPAEIIVIDDASTTAVEPARLPGGPAPVRVMRNPRSLGGAGSRNAGIRASTSELVAFLDDDDRWDPTKMERQLAAFAAAPGAAACVCGRRVERDGRVFDEVFTQAFAWRFRHHENHFGSFTQLIARVRQGGRTVLLDERLRSCQDWDYILALARTGPVVVVPEALCTLDFHRGPRISNQPAKQRGYRRFHRKHRREMGPRAQAWLVARALFAAAGRSCTPAGRMLFSGLGAAAALASGFPLPRRAVSAVRWSIEAWIGYERVEDLRFRWRAGPGRRFARLLGVGWR